MRHKVLVQLRKKVRPETVGSLLNFSRISELFLSSRHVRRGICAAAFISLIRFGVHLPGFVAHVRRDHAIVQDSEVVMVVLCGITSRVKTENKCTNYDAR